MNGNSRIGVTGRVGRFFRRLLAGLMRASAYALIALASLIALFQLALPWWASDAARVERLLAGLLGMPVAIERSAAEWRSREAVLRLHRLAIGDGDGFVVEQAELRLAPLNLLVGSPLAELRFDGLSLLADWADGSFLIAGLPLGAGGASWPGLLRLTVERGDLTVRELPGWPKVKLDQLALVLEPSLAGERWSGHARLPGGGGWLSFVFDRTGKVPRAYVRVEAADLGLVLAGLGHSGIGVRGGEGSLELWLDVGEKGALALAAEFSLSRIGFFGRHPLTLRNAAIEPRRTMARIAGWLRAERTADRWQVIAGDLAVDSQEGGVLAIASDGAGVRLHLGKLPIHALLGLAALGEGLPEVLRAWLFASAPQGVLESLELEYDHAGIVAVRGEASALRFDPALGLPGLAPLRAQFQGDGAGMVIEFVPEEARMEWPGALVEALPLVAARLSLVFARDRIEVVSEGLRLGALPLDFRLDLDPADSERGLAAAVIVGRSEIGELAAQLPYGLIPPRTAGWLRRALRSGALLGGFAVFQGPPRAWPFADGEGGLRVSLALSEGELAFHSRWPSAYFGGGWLEFRDRSLRFAAKAGQLSGLGVTFAEGEIQNLDRAELSLRAVAVGRGQDVLRLLRESPLVHRYGPWLLGQRADGTVEGEVELLLRLDDPEAPDEVRGRVRLHGLSLHDAKWDFTLAELSGDLVFDHNGLRADGLSARIGAAPLRLRFASGASCRDPSHAFEAELAGRLGLAEVLDLFGLAGQLPLQGSGSADWHLSLALARDASADLRLHLSSSLRGIALMGPEPFVKALEQSWPLEAVLERAGEGRERGALRLASWLSAVWRRTPAGVSALVRLGNGPPAREPPAQGLRLEGRVSALAVDPWLGRGIAGQLPLDLDLAAERLLVFGSDFGATTLRTRRDGPELVFACTGERLEGQARWRSESQPRLFLLFDRLHWPLGGDGAAAVSAIDPRRLPEIDAHVGSLKIGEADLGALRLETRSEGDGLQITTLQARNAAFSLHGRGWWLKRGEDSRSRIALELTAPQVARALAAFGFAPSVADGPVLVEAELEWAGSPLDLALERLGGRLRVESGPGRLLAVEPGAGRLLGLISLESLPKRIMLDFRDVLAPGMSFDGFRGTFWFAEGSARTDDFELFAPGVRVGIRGATDLRARVYDQRVEVWPEFGGALPVLGALTAGAPGIAAGMLARQVLAGPLGSIGRVEYHLSGPWERPVLTRLAAAPRAPLDPR